MRVRPHRLAGRYIPAMTASLLTAVLLVTQGTAASGAPSDDTRLTGLAFSTSAVPVSGMQVRYLTVRLVLSDPDGVPVEESVVGDAPIRCPCVVVTNTSFGSRDLPARRTLRLLQLRLVQGTPEDGVWEGRFAVSAADAGIWRATSLVAGDLHDEDLWGRDVPVPAPFGERAVNVRGYDRPLIWLGTRVRVGPGVDLVRGGMNLASGRPVAGARLEIRDQCGLTNHPTPFAVTRTDAAGRYAFTVRADAAPAMGVCAALAVYPTDALDNLVVQSNIRSLAPVR